MYASMSNNIPATIQIIPSTNEFSIISNHTAIYINPSGIPTIIAQVIKNLNNRILLRAWVSLKEQGCSKLFLYSF